MIIDRVAELGKALALAELPSCQPMAVLIVRQMDTYAPLIKNMHTHRSWSHLKCHSTHKWSAWGWGLPEHGCGVAHMLPVPYTQPHVYGAEAVRACARV